MQFVEIIIHINMRAFITVVVCLNLGKRHRQNNEQYISNLSTVKRREMASFENVNHNGKFCMFLVQFEVNNLSIHFFNRRCRQLLVIVELAEGGFDSSP